MLHLEITNRQRMQMVKFGSLGNYTHVQHIMFSPYHTVIVRSVIFLLEFLIIDQNIYLFIINDKNKYFGYELLWV